MIATSKKNGGHIGNNDSALTPNPRMINGYGDTSELSVPELAIYGFYKAFNEKNMAAITKIWANTEDITIENPAGGFHFHDAQGAG